MIFQENHPYHIYNQANGNLKLFKDNHDYQMFLEKLRKWVYPSCDILAYCLMPNHFHILVHANEQSGKPRKLGSLTSNELSNGVRLLQSQYSHYFNKKYESRGSIFRSRPKAKALDNGSTEYALTCFLYILQNPVRARLCKDPFGWQYSTANPINRREEDSLVNWGVLKSYIDLDWGNFENEVKGLIDFERETWTL